MENRKKAGQITVETAIVLPIVMVVIAFLITISLYVYDVVTIKSFVYSLGVENEEKDFDTFERNMREGIQKIPVFIIKPSISCRNKSTYFQINITAEESRKFGRPGIFSDRFIYEQTIKIEKKMSKENLYGYRAIRDSLE